MTPRDLCTCGHQRAAHHAGELPKVDPVYPGRPSKTGKPENPVLAVIALSSNWNGNFFPRPRRPQRTQFPTKRSIVAQNCEENWRRLFLGKMRRGSGLSENSYYKGISASIENRFARLIRERKAAMRAKMVAEQTNRPAAAESKALVLIESVKRSQIQKYMNDHGMGPGAPQYEQTHYESPASVINGYEFGYRDGHRVQLNNRQVETES